MAQDPAQSRLVGRQHAVEQALAQRVKAAVALASGIAQELRAHHRGERQRDDRGHQDRGADGDGEFAEQAADEAAHQQHRDEHGDQRDTDRRDGEANLLRAFQRGLERRITVLEIAGDVLDHDDRVVDNETGGDGQPHER